MYAPPLPDLRIVPTGMLIPHEHQDSQRSGPLIERLRRETVMINPPIVAPLEDGRFVILDGANRAHAFTALGYPHMLVQAARYADQGVDLETWHHLVCGWNEIDFTRSVRALPAVVLNDAAFDANAVSSSAVARLTLSSGQQFTLESTHPVSSLEVLNAAVCDLVAVYHQHAALHRTPSGDWDENHALHPDAIALVQFRPYTPEDILQAARESAFLPPGVSRHIVHGRAIRVNYPLDALRDPVATLEAKNVALTAWLHDKAAQRQIRFYAESTYQFDE